jgi:hypothetical protein
MGGKGGPQQLPQGMGGYMQQMAMNRYAQPQFQPQPGLLGQMPNMGGLASLGLGGYGGANRFPAINE